MTRHITAPSIITSAGNTPKVIEEYVGRVNSGTSDLSIARMKSPSGWVEPAQKPEFDEFSLVLYGLLRVTTDAGEFDVRAGECVIVGKGERVQYSTPGPDGAEYVAVCLPAFAQETVHREG